MITVKEIARMCDVSPSTVSNILNGKSNMTVETREKVLKCVEETGYRPNFFAQGMRRQNSRVICIIAEELLQFSTPPIVEAIMATAEARGYRSIIINMSMYEKWKKTGVMLGEETLLRENISPALMEAQAMRADGVIYVAAHGHVVDRIPDDFGIPIVFGYAHVLSKKYKSVLLDDCGAGDMVVKHLIDSGHDKIGVVAGLEDNLHTIERLKGYKNALKKAGLKYDESCVEYAEWERVSGKEASLKLIDKGIRTLWCMNDLMAAGAYDAALERKLEVGKDISIFGFDNREISEYMYPQLSTCELPLEEIGRECANLMIREIEDEEFRNRPATVQTVPCKLVLRDSINI